MYRVVSGRQSNYLVRRSMLTIEGFWYLLGSLLNVYVVCAYQYKSRTGHKFTPYNNNVCMYVCMYVCMCMVMCVCVCMCVYVCVCVLQVRYYARGVAA